MVLAIIRKGATPDINYDRESTEHDLEDLEGSTSIRNFTFHMINNMQNKLIEDDSLDPEDCPFVEDGPVWKHSFNSTMSSLPKEDESRSKKKEQKLKAAT